MGKAINQQIKMSEKLKGFLRGIGYAVVFAILDYVSTHIAGSGLVSTGIAGIITGVVGSLEHFLNDPNAPKQ
jgi:tetrahydromethanopterin S-methyltransferase subunit F